MHERTQRLLCQMVFVFACALPTAGTIAAVMLRKSSWFHDWQCTKLEQQLTDRFGLSFEIGKLEVLAPQALQLESVRVIDPETEAEVASVRLIQWYENEGRAVVRLSQPAVASQHLAKAWHLMHDRFLCRPQLAKTPVRLVANDFTIHSSTGGLTLVEFKALMQPHDYANETVAQFKIAGRQMQTPVAVSITRDRSRIEPETIWKFHTGGTALPCSVLADYIPWLQSFGATANFNGSIRWRLLRDGWIVDLSDSEFSNIEISRIFDHLEHKVTGNASVWLSQCRIEHGLITEMMGALSIDHGQIGQSLLQAANAHLGMRTLVPVQRTTLPFDQLRLSFAFDNRGWQFAGACGNEALRNMGSNQQTRIRLPAGCLATIQGKPLALLSTTQFLEAGVPKRMFVPIDSAPVFQGERDAGIVGLLPDQSASIGTGITPHAPRVPRTALIAPDSSELQ